MEIDQFTKSLALHQKLSSRLSYSQALLERVRMKAAEELRTDWSHVSVFAAGSLGRFETGRESDLDIFFLAKQKVVGNQPRTISRLEEIQLLRT